MTTELVIMWLWFEPKGNDKGLCKLILAKIQNINQAYRWKIDLVNVIITTKRKIDNKTYFELAPKREAIVETIA